MVVCLVVGRVAIEVGPTVDGVLDGGKRPHSAVYSLDELIDHPL